MSRSVILQLARDSICEAIEANNTSEHFRVFTLSS